ncbi:hypothetical protein MASR2M47_19730 [Draconibacterium sp.]
MDKTMYNFLKSIVILLAIVLFTNCLKVVEIDSSGAGSEIVVKSFFTDSLPWEVNIYKTFNLNESGSSDPVANAQVSITGNGNTIFLQHGGEGIYKANEYPEVGVEYKLSVEIEGREDITAQSSVPFKSRLSGITLDPKERTVVTSYSTYYSMVSTSFTITPPENIKTLCRVRMLLFDTIAGYDRYYFDADSYDRMLENGVDAQLVNNLKVLKGQIVFGPLWDFLAPKFGETQVLGNSQKIADATFLDRIDYRDPDAFWMGICVAPAGMFYRTRWEDKTLLGDFSEKTPADVFTGSGFNGEYWLEFMDLSPEYYQFQKDYLLQISNRGDISGTPVIVYSNINNATGIFAGYHKQMFLLDNLTKGNSSDM